MPAEMEISVKNMLDSIFFTRLFVSERKQIAIIADEKSPARISHRIFATKSLRKEESMYIIAGLWEQDTMQDFL